MAPDLVALPAPAAGDASTARDEFSEALHMDPDHQLVNKEMWLGLCKAQVGHGCPPACLTLALAAVWS